MQKKSKTPRTTRTAKPDRFAVTFKRAAQLAEDHITERALNIHDLIDSTAGSFDQLVNAIDPSLIKRGADIESRLVAALPPAKRSLVEEFNTFTIEEQDAERQAAYLIGVCVGMRLAGGAR